MWCILRGLAESKYPESHSGGEKRLSTGTINARCELWMNEGNEQHVAAMKGAHELCAWIRQAHGRKY